MVQVFFFFAMEVFYLIVFLFIKNIFQIDVRLDLCKG